MLARTSQWCQQLTATLEGQCEVHYSHTFQPVEEASATDLRGTKALLSLLVAYTASSSCNYFLLRHLSELLTPPFHPFVERADARFVEASLHPSARDSETARQKRGGLTFSPRICR